MPAAGSVTPSPSLVRSQPSAEREVVERELVAFGQEHGAFDGVPQLANVPRPGIRLQPRHRVRRDARDPLPEFGVVARRRSSSRASGMSSARWRSGGSRIGTTFKPIVEILAEVPLADLVFERSIRRRDRRGRRRAGPASRRRA